MDGVSEFLAMGGYAAFVWPAFAVTAAVMIGLLVASSRGLRKESRTLDSLRPGRRRGRRDSGEAEAEERLDDT